MPPLCLSILPDGSPEMVSAAMLSGIPEGELRLFEGPVADDAHLASWNVTTQTYPSISRDVRVQASYLRMRLDGQSHNMAEILAIRKFPALRTDTTFNTGRVNGNQFEACQVRGDWYKARATEAGVSTTGKYYSSALARFPGDPQAWISDRGDVLRVAKANGMSVSGDVNYQAPERDPGQDIEVAEDIVSREVDAYMANDPGERRVVVEDRIRSALTGRVDNNPILVED